MNSTECFNRVNWESILNFIVFGTEPVEQEQDTKAGLQERIRKYENEINHCIRSTLEGNAAEQEIEKCSDMVMSCYERLEILNLELGLKIGFLLANKLSRF